MATHPDGLALLADIAAIKADLRTLYVTWCISGPTLEATSALAAMAQEEGGHRRITARLAGKTPPTEAASQLFGPARIEAWPDFVGWVGPVEVALAGILERLGESDAPQIARNLMKMAAEERYHAEFYLSWFQELEKNDNLAGRQFKAARHAGEAAVARWLRRHAAVLAESGLTIGHRLPAELEGNVRCVSCGSLQTRVTASFGSSLMTAQMRCLDCGGQFEAVRHRGDPPT
jgi:1,2-phenylacetyl-CoA epoxidase catalytic subunit